MMALPLQQQIYSVKQSLQHIGGLTAPE